jgi:hypothetical protein
MGELIGIRPLEAHADNHDDELYVYNDDEFNDPGSSACCLSGKRWHLQGNHLSS